MNEIMEKHLGKPNVFLMINHRQVLCLKIIAHFKDADVNTGEYAAGKR